MDMRPAASVARGRELSGVRMKSGARMLRKTLWLEAKTVLVGFMSLMVVSCVSRSVQRPVWFRVKEVEAISAYYELVRSWEGTSLFTVRIERMPWWSGSRSVEFVIVTNQDAIAHFIKKMKEVEVHFEKRETVWLLRGDAVDCGDLYWVTDDLGGKTLLMDEAGGFLANGAAFTVREDPLSPRNVIRELVNILLEAEGSIRILLPPGA